MSATVLLVGQAIFVLIALCIITFDLRQMRIPDILSLALIALFGALCVIETPIDLWARLGLALAVFVLGFIAFSSRIMGGGDVKIMTALALFVPIHLLAEVALLYSATLVLGTALVLGVRRFIAPRPNWAFLETKRMPMGVCIGLAAAVAPFAFV